MSTTTLRALRLFAGGYEVTADHYQGSLTRQRAAVEHTRFGDTSRRYLAGLKSCTFNLNGYFEADGDSAIDDVYTAQLLASGAVVLTIGLPDGAEGAAAYSFEAVMSEYHPFGGSIGDMPAFSVSGSGISDSFRGILLEDGQTARSSSGTGSAVQLSDVASGETARAALHVIATTGSPTLDVVIQSDDNSGMTSATDRITFAQATAQGAQFESDATVHSDDYWRVSYTFGGTGSVTFVVNFGIA